MARGKEGVDDMMRAIARYGIRSIPGDEKEIVAAFRRGEAVNGPAIAEFEERFAEYPILGLRALEGLDEFNRRSRAYAGIYTSGLAGWRAIATPQVMSGAEDVFYQYCIYVSNPGRARRRAIRRGVDLETTHVDVCSSLSLFREFAANCPEAEKTAAALQLPVYSRRRPADVERVRRTLLEVTFDLAALADRVEAPARTEEVTAAAARAMRAN